MPPRGRRTSATPSLLGAAGGCWRSTTRRPPRAGAARRDATPRAPTPAHSSTRRRRPRPRERTSERRTPPGLAARPRRGRGRGRPLKYPGTTAGRRDANLAATNRAAWMVAMAARRRVRGGGHERRQRGVHLAQQLLL